MSFLKRQYHLDFRAMPQQHLRHPGAHSFEATGFQYASTRHSPHALAVFAFCVGMDTLSATGSSSASLGLLW